jgi:hypothetical protein
MAPAGANTGSETDGGAPSPEEQVRTLYEQAESQTAKALEELVSKPSFGRLMAASAENVAALSRIGSEVFDLVLRNFRLAGRADIVRLARQLHRTEDKLERLLQEVELLRDEVARDRAGQPAGQRTAAGRRQRGTAGNSSDREEAEADADEYG